MSVDKGDAHMNKININLPIAQILDEHPELLDFFINKGFKPLENKGMREKIGRRISLKRGSKMIGASLDEITEELRWNGYKIEGE